MIIAQRTIHYLFGELFSKQIEIKDKQRFLLPMIDVFRDIHVDEQKFTWWPYAYNARERNVSWRLDYIFISENRKTKDMEKVENGERYMYSVFYDEETKQIVYEKRFFGTHESVEKFVCGAETGELIEE